LATAFLVKARLTATPVLSKFLDRGQPNGHIDSSPTYHSDTCNNTEPVFNQTPTQIKIANQSEYYGPTPVDLQLTSANYVKGYLPDKLGIVIIVNSGATHSLISGACVSNSPCLSKLPRVEIEPINFRIDNGEYLHATQALNVDLTIQGHKLKLHVVIS
jgi:hypothetical protein